MALKVQVTSKGNIPRGLGLGPRLTPFNADKLLCATILSAGFTMKFIHPETGSPVDLTKKNLNRMFELYDGKAAEVKAAVNTTVEKKVETPVTPQPQKVEEVKKVESTPVIEKVAEVKAEVKTEETKTEEATMTPVTKENTQKNNNQNNNNQKNNNNNKK